MIETKGHDDGAAPLDELLAGQEELLDELDTLAGRQSELVAQAGTEALLELQTAEYQRGTVAQVIEKGYRQGERLLRPAKVAVAR